MKTKIPPNYQKIIDDAWLGITVKDSTLYNPLAYTPPEFEDEPFMYILWLMQQPEYFSFICKEVLGIQLLPIQSMMLKEMWYRKFPMLVASRGFGKSFMLAVYALLRILLLPQRKIIICGAAFRQSKIIFNYMENIWYNAPLLRDLCDENSGPKHEADMFRFHIGDSVALAIPIGDGCGLGDTLITYDDGFGRLDRFGNKNNNRNIGVWGVSQFNHSDEAYYNGVKPVKLITTKIGLSFGGTNNHRLKILDGIDVKWKRLDQINTGDKILIDRSYRWHNGQSDCTKTQAYQIGFNLKNKSLPPIILSASRECMTACIHGLFDAYGTINKDSAILTNSNEMLIKQLQYILLHYGIISIVSNHNDIYRLEINSNFINEMKLKHKQRINNIYYDKVIDIKDIGEHDTYDLHVPNINEYCANGFYSHNSKIRGQRANDIFADEFACLEYNTIIQTDIGMVKIKDYFNTNAYSLINMNNEFETPTKIFKTPLTDVYKITTKNGYSFKCSSIHKVYTTNGWKIAKDLTTDDFLEVGMTDYFPPNYATYKNVVVDENVGWLIGLLVSEGVVTNRNYVNIINTDKTLIDLIKTRLNNYDWKLYTKKAYKDNRGWDCKQSYTLAYNNTEFRTALYKLGVDYVTSHNKEIPSSILQSPRPVVIEFLRGLFIGDGSCYTYNNRGKKRIGVAYYSVSENLIDQLQILLLKFGITCTKTNRRSKLSINDQWMLGIRGINCKTLVELLDIEKWNKTIEGGSYAQYTPYIRKNGKRQIISTYRANKSVHLGTFDTVEECQVAFNTYVKHTRPVFRVKSVELLDEKEHLYDFYLPKTHSFYGNGFVQHNSQSREVFENVIAGFASVKSSPIINVQLEASITMAKKLGYKIPYHSTGVTANQIVLSGTAYYDFNHFGEYWKRWRSIIRSKGDSKKLREVFGDEDIPENFDWRDYSIIRLPFELIPKGFMDEAMVARSKATVHSGIYSMEFGSCVCFDTLIQTKNGVKKIIDIKIGDYVFTHKGRFRKVTKLYRRPYRNKICKIITDGCSDPLYITPEHLILHNTQFVPISDIVYNLELVTNNRVIKQNIISKELVDYNGYVYNLEVEEDNSYSTLNATIHNCFSNDSNGFFKRTLIESCVLTNDNEITLPSGKVQFSAALKGRSDCQYIYGIDPASEVDNFSIIILEHHPDHRRIVYSWTTNKKDHREKLKMGIVTETEFYSYCARKIRDLMKVFPCIRLALDSQGGGIAISEALHDLDKIDSDDGEVQIWPIIETGKVKDTDGEPGLHIIEMINFASADWTSEANHGLRKDFEDKVCIFPFFDSASLGLANIADEQGNRLYDTLEDCVLEIEELKNELSTIVITQTSNGRDRWDTPEVKLPGNKKGRLRKDRYSSLVMANMSSRQMARNPDKYFTTTIGGWAGSAKAAGDKQDYVGASWLVEGLTDIY